MPAPREPLHVWLHLGHDGDPGVVAFAPDQLGFATWSESEAELLAALPAKFADYASWRARHGLPVAAASAEVEVLGSLTGNEILFPCDREAATTGEIDLALALLRASRADLMADLEAAPEAAFDWDPPYARFAPWANWRTIRAILAHVANGETHYYTRSIGYEPEEPPADATGDWREFLPRSRERATKFLEGLRGSDLGRVRAVDLGMEEEWWSLRKALRRLVAHERGHAKSIRRILREHRLRSA
jgi:hypothetical protein